MKIKLLCRVMRLLILFLTAGFLQLSARSYSQTVTLKGERLSLTDVFTAIQQQTGYLVFGDAGLLEKGRPVSVDAKNMQLEDFLAIVLRDQPVKAEVKGKNIRLSRISALSSLPDRHPSLSRQVGRPDPGSQQTLTGQFLNSETNDPIVGVSVNVKGARVRATSDGYGHFSLSGFPDNAVFVFSSIGFSTLEISYAKLVALPLGGSLSVKENKLTKLSMGTFVFYLSTQVSTLDETVVIAYGTTSKKLNTGDVSTVKAEDIQKQPVNNPLLALAGRVPGLTVTQSSGMPGSGISIRIQGQNSIAKGVDPFFVIDGVPFTSQLMPNLGPLGISGANGSNFGASTGNPLSYINPTDIESIEVLKDADATAIYGSRAANGAILITTKKGKAGRTAVDVSLQQGFGKINRKLKLLNTQQYIAMRKEAFKNDGLAIPMITTAPTALNYDLTTWDTSRNTDWQDQLMGGTASYTDGQIALSGGNNQTTFKINGGFHREGTVFPGNFSDKKISLGLNINHSTLNKKLNVQFTASYLNDNNFLPSSDITSTAINIAPNAPKLYKADGTLNWERIKSGTDSVSTWLNPLATFSNIYQVTGNNLLGNLLVTYQLAKGLTLKSSFGYSSLITNEFASITLESSAPERRPTQNRIGQYGSANVTSWIIEPQITYSKIVGAGKLDFLVGSTFQQSTSKDLILKGTGYNSDQVLKDIKSSSTITVSNSVDANYKYSAGFGRATYNYQNRYIVNATARRDGSSRFGPENSFHNFAAIGGAWLFSNENLLKLFSILSFGKLSASYGSTGNDQIGDYQYLSLYSVITGITNAYQATTGLEPTKHVNPLLQWETTKKLNVGLDLGFLRDAILFNIRYFNNRSSNQLISYNLPISTGFSSVTRNFPAEVENKGWEISLSTKNITTKNFSWTTNANLTVPRNTLISFPGLATSSYGSALIIGQPVGITKLYKSAGINPNNGLFQFLSSTGNITTTPSATTDMFYVYSPAPKYYGGLENNVNYKFLSLSFLFQFVKQLGTNYYIGNVPGNFAAGATSTGFGNQPISVLDRWQNASVPGSIQKFSTVLSTFEGSRSDLTISDASFIRLKNVSLSYLLPIKKLQRAELFIHAQNLLTITSFKGLDPETRSTIALPPLRIFTLGLKATL